MIKKWAFLLALLPVTALKAFVITPWFSSLAEFQLRSGYSYRYYPDVESGFNPTHYHSHDHRIDLNLGVRCLPNWDLQLELDCAKTTKLDWGTQRFGSQLRYLFLDDIAGAPVSVVGSFTYFYVTTRNLSDVSSPYHAQSNFELGVAVGKEFDRTFEWVTRFWGFVGLGTANRGYPWLRPILAGEVKWAEHHKLGLFGEGYFGFGSEQSLNINRFDGYGHIQHQSLDFGLNYIYLFKIWGDLKFQYAYRIFARHFPEKASTFLVEYRLPFSLF